MAIAPCHVDHGQIGIQLSAVPRHVPTQRLGLKVDVGYQGTHRVALGVQGSDCFFAAPPFRVAATTSCEGKPALTGSTFELLLLKVCGVKVQAAARQIKAALITKASLVALFMICFLGLSAVEKRTLRRMNRPRAGEG